MGLALVVLFIGAFILVRRQQSRARRERERLSVFLSPSVVRQVLDHQVDLQAGLKEVSVIFIDLRRFTEISEKLGAEDTSALLRDFYEICTDLIFKFGGTVDKYIGDSVMAFFGAPDALENHASQSVKCAQAILGKIAKGMEKWNFDEPVSCGISIATGTSMVGPIGVKSKTDYTVIGPIVNLASRMEGLNNRYSSKLIISDVTRLELDADAPFEHVGPIAIRGIRDPQIIHIYKMS